VALLDIRQRAGILFLVVTLGHIILISAQVSSRRGVPVLEAVTFGVFAEVQRGVSSLASAASGFWSGYVVLRDVRAENELLREELANVRIDLQRQRALADRSRGLGQLLALRTHIDLDTSAAEIIASGATPDFRTFTIDKGTNDGIDVDMAVIAPDGVVGRVVVPSARAAKVQLLIDRNAAAGVLVTRSRAQGVVVGGGDDRLHLRYVSEAADVAVGDQLVTSGIDGIYHKGFAIGEVTAVDRSGRVYKDITVRPAVDFSRVEAVLVVRTPPPARGVEEEGGL
jgi:rod shape-determining protein MreC